MTSPTGGEPYGARIHLTRQAIASVMAVTVPAAVVIAAGGVIRWLPPAVPAQSGAGLPMAGALRGVAVVSPQDAWAVGYQEVPASGNSAVGFAADRPSSRSLPTPSLPGGALPDQRAAGPRTVVPPTRSG